MPHTPMYPINLNHMREVAATLVPPLDKVCNSRLDTLNRIALQLWCALMIFFFLIDLDELLLI